MAGWPEGAWRGGEEGPAEREDWGGGQQEGEQGPQEEEKVQKVTCKVKVKGG